MVTYHAPLQHSFKQQDLNKCQTQWLQELIDTSISILYQPSKQAAVPNALSGRPILHDSIDDSADSQTSGVV